jgi:plastocyanin
MKIRLSRLKVALAMTIAALAISLFPATSYAASVDYWPPYPVPYPGYGSSYGCVHGVGFGETLSGIAVRYGTSVYYLTQINGIPNPNLIYAGMSMRVPCAPIGYPSYPYPGSMYPPYRYPQSYPGSMYPPYRYPQSYPGSMYPPQPYPAPIHPPQPYPTPMPMPTPPGSGQIMVVMRNIAFNPAMITIHVGQTVVWRNDDAAPHTTTSGTCPNGVCTPMPGWDSGTLNPGQSFSHQFTTTGTFPYYCRIHGAMMQGTIVVMP